MSLFRTAPAGALPAAPSPSPPPRPTSSTTGRSRGPTPRDRRSPSSPWAASGAWSASSGRFRACGSPRSATRAARRPIPTYRETCTGHTGHTEAVRVVLTRRQVSYEALLKLFWEGHDPTQGDRQGNDVGSQYRSAIFTHSADQALAAERSREAYQGALTQAGRGVITTEIDAGGSLLLRRGLPPAVPGQEPGRLLRYRRHRRGLPDRGRRRSVTLDGARRRSAAPCRA